MLWYNVTAYYIFYKTNTNISKMKKNPKNVTMNYIADVSNVSIATVSRVFDPTTKNKVSVKTFKKIMKLADELGYRPNRTAQALSRGGTNTIGLILPAGSHFSTSEFYARVIMNTAIFLRERNYDIKLHILRDDEEIENIITLKQSLGLDGIIMIGIPFSSKFRAASCSSLPVVMMSSGTRRGITTVNVDNFHGSWLAAEYFHKNGHKKFGMLTGPANSPDVNERKAGYIKYIKDNKLRVNKNWFLPCRHKEQDGYEAGLKLLKQRSKPTAVFCSNDEVAFGLIRAAKKLGMNCPKDIAIIGFDNLSATQYSSPPLTTIEQPIIDMTSAAVDLLLKLIKKTSSTTHEVFPAKIIERKSV